MTTTEDAVIVMRDAEVLIVRLNRPQARNAISAAVARALVSSPEIVFADEPFAGLSDEDAATVLACLHDVVADGGTVIVTCTDPRARLHGVRQLVLDRGRLLSDEVAFATH